MDIEDLKRNIANCKSRIESFEKRIEKAKAAKKAKVTGENVTELEDAREGYMVRLEELSDEFSELDT